MLQYESPSEQLTILTLSFTQLNPDFALTKLFLQTVFCNYNSVQFDFFFISILLEIFHIKKTADTTVQHLK